VAWPVWRERLPTYSGFSSVSALPTRRHGADCQGEGREEAAGRMARSDQDRLAYPLRILSLKGQPLPVPRRGPAAQEPFTAGLTWV